ncbi:MAG TPA: transporter substrate-binding domain-containing protein [Desulfomonilia bacterium]|nr:transporter substrate-binding domain-containing protein [Desulfomonilia bacterium]
MKVKCFLSLFFFICIIYALPVSADQIVVIADPWCPFTCEPGSADPGYMIEIAQAVFTKSGHTVVYKNLEWKKAIEETRKGKYTAIVGGIKSDAPDFIYPDKSEGTSQNVFFIKKGTSWKYNGIDSLKKVKLGVIQGYSYSEALDKYIADNPGKPDVQVASGDTPLQQNIDRLMKGQIDVFIEDPSVYGNYCGSKNLIKVLGAIQAAGSDGPPEKIYIAFSPANPKSKGYATELSAGIVRMRKSGELKKLLSKYYLKDWE